MSNPEQLLAILLQQFVAQRSTGERALELAGFRASSEIRKLQSLRSLADAEFRVYSQFGEDGIIDWLIEHINVSAERFIEFGVESYVEANTRFLLKRRNWKGLVIDGSPENVRTIQGDAVSRLYDLTSLAHFITRDNINALFSQSGFIGAIGLLSIDIDGMDYWVWDRIAVVRPDIVVCEYNGAFGDLHPITVPYDPDFQRYKAHFSGHYYGASIGALCQLAARKGYSPIGSNLKGCNAFFVADAHFQAIGERIADRRPRAPRFRVSRDRAQNFDHKSTLEAYEQMKDMPVQRVDTGEVVPLGSLGDAFSAEWLDQVQATR
ncbi:MAG TPA: hypothetical protein VMB81_16285 [Candidatus Sulfotelmatobacter sp.]|nr:hypothetical protein [Candidatus Sulfotelmatobacter sp.]